MKGAKRRRPLRDSDQASSCSAASPCLAAPLPDKVSSRIVPDNIAHQDPVESRDGVVDLAIDFPGTLKGAEEAKEVRKKDVVMRKEVREHDDDASISSFSSRLSWKLQRKALPFNIPASEIDHNIFVLTNPFINVVSKYGAKHVDAHNKFVHAWENPMKMEVLCTIVDQLIDDVINSTEISPRASTELGWRDTHISYFKPARYITNILPTIEPASKKQKVEGNTTGLYIRTNEDYKSFPRGLESMYEGNNGVRQLVEKRFNIEMLTHDTHVAEGDDLVTIAYSECKKAEDDLHFAIYQAATYARSAALMNMQKGRFKPIFLFGLAKFSWRCGMLLPIAQVHINNGQVMEVHSNDEKDYNQMLASATQALTATYPTQIMYPDGVYLSGYLFVDPKARLLPQEGVSYECMRQFYQPWIEIVAGRQAYEWNVEEAERRLAQNKALFLAKKRKFLEPMVEVMKLKEELRMSRAAGSLEGIRRGEAGSGGDSPGENGGRDELPAQEAQAPGSREAD